MYVILENGSFFSGPGNQSSMTALVRVRAWMANSLPDPDFVRTGIPVRANSSARK